MIYLMYLLAREPPVMLCLKHEEIVFDPVRQPFAIPSGVCAWPRPFCADQRRRRNRTDARDAQRLGRVRPRGVERRRSATRDPEPLRAQALTGGAIPCFRAAFREKQRKTGRPQSSRCAAARLLRRFAPRNDGSGSSGTALSERRLEPRRRPELRFDLEQAVVFGDALAAARRPRLDLAAAHRDREIGEERVLGFA